MNFKNLITILIISVATLSCKTADVYFDYDPNAKFDSYSNFMVMSHMKSYPIQEQGKAWLHSAIKDQMGKRGYSESKSPDLLVKIMIKANKKETTSYDRHDNFYWADNYYSYGWGVNTGVNRVNYNSHTEGTIIIDVIDREKKELIWQGSASGAVKDKTKLTEQSVNRIIKKLFATYPLAPKK